MYKTARFLIVISLALSFFTPAAHASIQMTKLQFQPIAYLNDPTNVKVSLKSNTKIQVSGYLLNSFNEKIEGSVKDFPRNLRNGTWNIAFTLASNARTGKYQLFINAKSRNKTFRISNKYITFEVNQQLSKSNLDASQTEKTDRTSDVVFNSITMGHMKLLPSYAVGLKPTCIPGSSCPKTDEASLENPAKCKISDATYPDDSSEGYVSSAFPPAKYSLAGFKEVNLLWIPINFKDRKIDQTYYEKAVKTAQDAEYFYSFNSFGRVDFNFKVLDKNSWVELPENYEFYEKLWSDRSIDITQYLLDHIQSKIQREPHAITWLFPEGKFSLPSKPFNGRTKFWNVSGYEIPATRVYGLHQEITGGGVDGYAHGIGHALYSFEDLYVFGGYSASGVIEKPASYWDIMGGGGEFFSWSKWIAGWLYDDEVLCLGQRNLGAVLEVHSLQSPVGSKLIAVPVSPHKIILAEFRTNSDEEYLSKFGVCQKDRITQCESRYEHSGLLIYSLDTTIKHGAAPFRVAQQTGQPLLRTGESLTFEGMEFKVVASSGNTIYVQVSRT
jgi:hypothetical protein